MDASQSSESPQKSGILPVGFKRWIALLLFLFAVPLFYSIADHFGKQALHDSKRVFEAKGGNLNWNDFIPPAVPDSENFFKVPGMETWFRRDAEGKLPIDWPPSADKDPGPPGGPIVHSINTIDYSPSVVTNWFEMHYQEELKLLEEACKRPRSYLPGDYSDPWESPMVHFVNLRQMVQTLHLLSESYLRLGRPDLAVRYVTMLRRLTDLEEPSYSLVATMIRVAVGGVYSSAITVGLESHVWKGQQLEILQHQLASLELLPDVDRAIRSEIAAVHYSFAEVVAKSETQAKAAIWNTVLYYCYPNHVPRGWLQRGMANYTQLMQDHLLTGFDPLARRIFPRKSETNSAVIKESRVSAKRYLDFVNLMIPDFSKALHTVAKNQTSVDLTLVACVLERYKQAKGEYPIELNALVPQFIKTLPNDVITGRSPIYRRNADGSFLLYSVGWNEVDNGGTTNDWVWPTITK